MSVVRFLLDQHVSKGLARALRASEPTIDVCRVGERNAPPFGSKDPDLIRFAESEMRILLTMDRETMLGHIQDHIASGGHTWGIFFIDSTSTWRELVDTLILVWSASQAEEWQDGIEYIPWKNRLNS